MADPLLTVTGLFKSFGALMAACDLDLEVAEGEVHALIGPNGAGKTTFLCQLSGEVKPDRGIIRFNRRNIQDLPVYKRVRLGLARSYQITSIFPMLSTEDNVAMAVQARSGHSFRFIKPAREDLSLRKPAKEILALVDLDTRANVPASSLSHGEQRQLELAMALAPSPRMLLLDEPMAGMSSDEVARLSDLLAGLRGRVTILLVEHDMDVVFALSDLITVLIFGRRVITGEPAEIRASDEVRAAYLG
ncbi:MAG: ABC transporter ATP-binding protein, partial [Desulfovibrionales bacterium]